MDAILERQQDIAAAGRQFEANRLFNTAEIHGHKLDLGSGADNVGKGDWTSFDISSAFGPNVLGMAQHLPFQDESFIAVLCHHVLEHIPRHYFVFHDKFTRTRDGAVTPAYVEQRYGLVDVMNEAWRVLKPKGQIWIEVPLFPTDDAMADPTHVSFFVPRTFDYFVKDADHDDHRRIYGFKPWGLVTRQRLHNGRAFSCVLEKIDE